MFFTPLILNCDTTGVTGSSSAQNVCNRLPTNGTIAVVSERDYNDDQSGVEIEPKIIQPRSVSSVEEKPK